MNSQRLWSLWDMLNLPIGKLINSYSYLSSFAQHIDSTNKNSIRFADREFIDFTNNINDLIEACEDFNLSITKQAAIEIQTEIAQSKIDGNSHLLEGTNFIRAKNYVFSMMHCIKYESKLKIALIIPSEREKLLTTEAYFGQDVWVAFPNADYDVSEAAKCFALERSTASVFHSIRCLEAGLYAISRCLSISDPTKGSERNWGNILRSIKTKMDKKWPNSSDRMSGDGQFFEELYGIMSSLQNPYRNGTMHLDRKYTEAEAKHTLDMIGGIMRKIASRMDEQGQPSA